MKNFFLVFALTIFCGAFADSVARAQEDARQLYLGYSTNDKLAAGTNKANQSKGRPGARVVIERMRKGKLAFVSPNSKFRSGDKIRLRLQTNFDGYLTVLNVGSTGAVDLLFPYANGGDARIVPAIDFQVPKADAWIVFDDNPGVETLTVIMSKRQVRAASEQERRELGSQIGDERDLYIATGSDATYAVCPEEKLDKPVGFTLRLKHQK